MFSAFANNHYQECFFDVLDQSDQEVGRLLAFWTLAAWLKMLLLC